MDERHAPRYGRQFREEYDGLISGIEGEERDDIYSDLFGFMLKEPGMPIYEFMCRGCEMESTFLTRSVNTSFDPICRHCGGTDLRKAISTFAHHRTIKDVHEAFPTPKDMSSGYYNDPRNIGRNVTDEFRKRDMDVPGEIKETIEAAREGVMPRGVNL